MGVKGAGIADLSHLGRPKGGGAAYDPMQEIAAHIRAIREAHVIEPLMMYKAFVLDTNTPEDVFDSQGRKVSWIIAQAYSGVVNLYWSDGGGSGALPPMRFESTPFPILIPVSVRPYTFTVRGQTLPAQFALTLVA